MTCIIGLVKKGTVYMGGDSAVPMDWDMLRVASPKVFRKGAFLFGFTTSFRMGQLLQYKLDIPEQGDLLDIAYMIGVVAEAIRECLKEGGYAQVKDNREYSGDFLVGYRGTIYRICSDFTVLTARDEMMAVGCGGTYALGVAKALDGLPPRERIERALEISAYFSAGVCPPFHIISSGADAPDNWRSCHHENCGTKFRGCDPNLCQKDLYERTGTWYDTREQFVKDNE